jgi:hypothetical protein
LFHISLQKHKTVLPDEKIFTKIFDFLWFHKSFERVGALAFFLVIAEQKVMATGSNPSLF